MDQLIERYLVLGLRLGAHVDGLVDAYYGPAALADRVAAEPPQDPAGLAAEAAVLRGLVADGALDDAARSRWLAAQLTGMETTARKLAGESISYVDEVRRCYGFTPRRVPEDEIARAHARLGEALAGPGTLAERYQAWRGRVVVPREAIGDALTALEAELRGRTATRFGLPEGEAVETDLVEHEPWLAFNYYVGGLRSRVVVNLDVPVIAMKLAELAAHEIYPGHHTEHATKEAALVRARGYDEESVFLVGTPQCLVSEGIAGYALGALGDDAERACAAILAEHGAEYDLDVVSVLREVEPVLGKVADNAALLLHEDGAPLEDVRAYLRRWSLRSDEDVAKSLEFITHPTWRAYVTTYATGEILVEQFVDGDPARFSRLLSEQLLPEDIGAVV